MLRWILRLGLQSEEAKEKDKDASKTPSQPMSKKADVLECDRQNESSPLCPA